MTIDLDGYRCGMCNAIMAGWASVQLAEPGKTQYENDRHLITIAACWECRNLLSKGFETENPRYNAMYAAFLREVVEDFRRFQSGVVNPQTLE